MSGHIYHPLGPTYIGSRDDYLSGCEWWRRIAAAEPAASGSIGGDGKGRTRRGAQWQHRDGV
jgi:hypothetical protein